MTEFYVKVEPGSDKVAIEEGSIPKIFLNEPAENGRANTELVSILTEILGGKPAIVSGHNSRRKKLRISGIEKDPHVLLQEFSGGSI